MSRIMSLGECLIKWYVVYSSIQQVYALSAFLSPMPLTSPLLIPKKARPVSLWGLVALIFFSVSGGPFGSEGAVAAAGPFWALIGFTVFPIIWCIPEALITAEMSSLLPGNAGFVSWVAAAFGPYWGFIEGWLSWVSGVTSNAIYPHLFLEYLVSCHGWLIAFFKSGHIF